MPILLSNSVYFRVPKTGSQFTRSVLINAGLVVEEVGTGHEGLTAIDKFQNKVGNKKLWATIRNPVTWYISYWASWHHRWRVLTGNHFKMDAIQPGEQNKFNLWLNRVFDEKPHYFSMKMRKYMGPNLDRMDYTCKQENLNTELLEVMERLGEKRIPEDVMKNTQNMNSVIPRFKILAKYNKATMARLLTEEEPFMKKFGYSGKVEDYTSYLKN